MNDVYQNPAYQKEINDAMQKLNVLLHWPPSHAFFEIKRLVEIVLDNKEYKDAITCGTKNNCSFCCHDIIIMGKIESQHIKKVIISRKIAPNIDRVKQQNSNKPIKWMDKACPLLLDENENGQRLCSIYDERPLICRTHNSTMDPSECNKEDNPKKVIREAKITILDGLGMTSFMLGNGSDKKDPCDSLVKLHEMLLDMI